MQVFLGQFFICPIELPPFSYINQPIRVRPLNKLYIQDLSFRCFLCSNILKHFLLLLGCIGFLANLLVLPVLLSKEMKNTFNHLLICLTIFDNVYVMCSILECIRKYFISTVEQMVSKINLIQ